MNSSRLPGKVLMKLDDKPNLQHVIERIQRAKTIHKVVVATTTNPKDKEIVKLCKQLSKVLILKGSENDVLERTIKAGWVARADIIVDITADCPLVDPLHIDKLVSQFIKKNVVYASNIINRTWPDGFDIQVYRLRTLLKTSMFITEKNYRQHSGWNILRTEKWQNMYSLTTKVMIYVHPEWNLSLDEETDYILLNKIFKHFGHNKFSCEDVMKLLNNNLDWLEINNDKIRKKSGEG